MELFTHRYRNLPVLVVAIVIQLLLLGYQVRGQQDVRLIRVWAVTAVMPVAKMLEGVRNGIGSLLDNYITLVNVRQQNRRLTNELGELKLEVQHLRSELAAAERAEALKLFQSRSRSQTIAARVIGAGTGADSKVVFIDRGSRSGVAKGMAVITPEGLVGRIRAAYPTASQAVLITDPSFACGVISQTNHVRGTLKGQGHGACIVDYVQNEQRVDVGEWFFTSGDDRVFPRGLPVGQVKMVRKGKTLKEILVVPSGLAKGLQGVLVVLEPVHQPLGGEPSPERAEMLPPPSPPQLSGGEQQEKPNPESRSARRSLSTDADKLLEYYDRVGEAQGHVFGEGVPGSPAPDFNLEVAPGEAGDPFRQ